MSCFLKWRGTCFSERSAKRSACWGTALGTVCFFPSVLFFFFLSQFFNSLVATFYGQVNLTSSIFYMQLLIHPQNLRAGCMCSSVLKTKCWRYRVIRARRNDEKMSLFLLSCWEDYWQIPAVILLKGSLGVRRKNSVPFARVLQPAAQEVQLPAEWRLRFWLSEIHVRCGEQRDSGIWVL